METWYQIPLVMEKGVFKKTSDLSQILTQHLNVFFHSNEGASLLKKEFGVSSSLDKEKLKKNLQEYLAPFAKYILAIEVSILESNSKEINCNLSKVAKVEIRLVATFTNLIKEFSIEL